jgi:hypothetical protein
MSGCVRTMNDVDIWDSSRLHIPITDGTFDANDFSFQTVQSVVVSCCLNSSRVTIFCENSE